VSPQLDFHESAELELNEAADFYDIRSPGLGSDFLDEVERGLGHIAEHPEAAARRSVMFVGVPGQVPVFHPLLGRRGSDSHPGDHSSKATTLLLARSEVTVDEG
jgi:hypothetical protein